MSQNIDKAAIPAILEKVNRQFNSHLTAEDFKSAGYSVSSLSDIISQKIQDEVSGDWTADVAFHKVREAISSVKGVDASSITMDSDLEKMLPAATRKSDIQKMNEHLGIEMKILKPNGFLYGFFILTFFIGLPMISIGWFPALITMVVSGIFIFILGKTANQLKMKTVGHLADHLAWRNYKKNANALDSFDKEATMRKVEAIIVS